MNNAGTAIPKPFEEATLEELDRVLDLNIRDVFVADTDLNPASGDWATPQKAVTALNRYGTVDEV